MSISSPAAPLLTPDPFAAINGLEFQLSPGLTPRFQLRLPICFTLTMTSWQGLRPSRLFWGFLLLWSMALTLLVYGRSLMLPFFFDDLMLLPLVAETPLGRLWREPAAFSYFRPLPSTFWRVSYLVWGSHQPVWLHGWNLLLHALNGWLVAYLGARLFARGPETTGHSTRLLALGSATLYLLFPFHFQAVPWVTAVYHLGCTTFALASVIAYVQYRETSRFRWAFIGGLLGLMSLFTLENGVLILPLVLAVELLSGDNWHFRRRWRALARPLPWAAPLLLWLPLWLLAPRTTSGLSLNRLETMGQNGAWIMQGVAFPLTWAGGWLRDTLGWNDLGTAVGLSLLALGGIAIGQGRGRVTSLSGYAWTWCALTGLPTLLLLPFAYLLSSPRLLTITAVGAAWLWSDLLTRLLAAAWGRRPAGTAALSGGLAVGLLILAVGPAWTFLQRQMTFHAMLGEAFWQLTRETVTANAAGKTVVAINFPGELGVWQPAFALGHEGVVFVAPYTSVDSIVSTQTGAPAQVAPLLYDDTRPELPYLAGVLGEGQNWPSLVSRPDPLTVLNTRYEADAVLLTPAGSWPGESSEAVLAEFRGADLPSPVRLQAAQAMTVAGSLRVDLTWQIAQPPPYTITVFVHVLSEDGALVAQADGYPWARTYPMGQWPAGAVVGDTRFISVGEDVSEVRVGLYDSTSGERMTVFASGAFLGPDNQVRLDVENADGGEW